MESISLIPLLALYVPWGTQLTASLARCVQCIPATCSTGIAAAGANNMAADSNATLYPHGMCSLSPGGAITYQPTAADTPARLAHHAYCLKC
jgi:hypothetical protein